MAFVRSALLHSLFSPFFQAAAEKQRRREAFGASAREAKKTALRIQEAILDAKDANQVLDVVGKHLEDFSPINGVTAVYRIARQLTSRAGEDPTVRWARSSIDG